jgi:dTMP kinase
MVTSSRMKSELYVFEGPDGVGKSTLASHVNAYLNQCGFPSELLAFPGREVGTLAEHIYRLYHDPFHFGIRNISIAPEQILVTAAHADVIENRLIPALSQGRNVVLDRYWWSTWVHSTLGNLPSQIRDLLIEVELFISKDVKPRCIFLVRRNRPADSEYHPDKWRRLVSLYDDIRARQDQQMTILEVDNNGDLQDTMRFVLDSIRAQHAATGSFMA